MDINYDNLRINYHYMNIEQNFKVFGPVDIQPLLDEYNKITEEDWEKFTWRQDANPMHGASKTIGIIYDQDFRHFNTTRHEFYNRINFGELVKPLTDISEGIYGPGYIVRAVLVKLPAGKDIKSHIDVGGSYNLSHRIHVPLVCEPDNVEYIVNGESRTFDIGTMFELNNMREHSVHNRSSIDRVNLLFDFAKYDGEGWWWR